MSARQSSFPAPVLVCMLGTFRVVALGSAVSLKAGGKAQALLATLALNMPAGVPREQLIDSLWPAADRALAGQSLNTLVYSLHRSLGGALRGRPPIAVTDGAYHLNVDDGVTVDIEAFDDEADQGDRAARGGDRVSAAQSYNRAAQLYVGDLVPTSEVRHVVERERLRARYLMMQTWLADLRFFDGDFSGSLAGALDLLAHDPCREDAHRLAMRSYNRLGQRAQAMRQYGICRDALAVEFDAVPEPATEDLYVQLRKEPARV